jgi:hypothetical protein
LVHKCRFVRASPESVEYHGPPFTGLYKPQHHAFCFAENHRLATDGRNVMSMLILLSSTEMCVLSIANVNTLVQPVKFVMFGDTTYNVKSQVNMSPKIFFKKT